MKGAVPAEEGVVSDEAAEGDARGGGAGEVRSYMFSALSCLTGHQANVYSHR